MRRVAVYNLKPGMRVERDVYSVQAEDAPLLTRHTTLTKHRIQRLYQHGVRFVFISDPTMKNVQEIEVSAKNMDIPEPVHRISTELQEEAIDNLHAAFEMISTGDVHKSSKVIKNVGKVVDQLIDSLLDDTKAMVNIADLKNYDDYTYHHSLSVAVLSLAMGQHLGFSRNELSRFGMCAILHDIGKTSIPLEILNKPTKLSAEEFLIMQSHSYEGLKHLLETAVTDEDIQMGVLNHHEKEDGTGYPNHLKGSQIPLWSKIISVADVYDALTSNRPYRTPMQPEEAIEYIKGGVDKSFDFDIVTAFSQKIEAYPVGSVVRLSNGKIAVVLKNEHQTRPVVQTIDTGDILDLFHDKDLMNVVVTELMADTKLVLS